MARRKFILDPIHAEYRARLAELRQLRAEWDRLHPARFIDPHDCRSNWSLAHPEENDEMAEIEEILTLLEPGA